ncbi:hypothetical protein M404DRAFT_1004908 [Pisolithus tinctorius Marx 270]|uniref:Uncharacterized protein n=1 Tax=Pisolithus tinctorius Marx 270 TaxID=870435 RepID=A0A0C3JP36_PISTI|nr:hypothetical protein M404DRAFT_1004908 [Pisolithus tinctorius Marx 270]
MEESGFDRGISANKHGLCRSSQRVEFIVSIHVLVANNRVVRYVRPLVFPKCVLLRLVRTATSTVLNGSR